MANKEGHLRYSLRQATMDDYEFLYNLHVLALRPYVEQLWGWEEVWQQEYFERKFEPQKRKVIQIEGQDAGVLVVQQSNGQTHIDLIELMPQFQGQGVGTIIITDICSQAHERGEVVTLHVLKSNIPARRLYERLGFEIVQVEEYRLKMQKKSPQKSNQDIT
ncbi:MAG: GNAT family N-acetyltransferase [Candidatus Promineifilaceae bacterium]|jgi:ribosomal protein S18 acetylase RimI-like enzyme